MSEDPKSANKPKKNSEPDDPSRDENHDESRVNLAEPQPGEEEPQEEE
jgi:hypothetical protein